MQDSSAVFEIINSVLSQKGNRLSVSQMCAIAGVSRSGYYAWLKAAPIRQAKEEQDRKDFDLILTAYKQRGYSKGARGIAMCLLHMEPPVVMNLKKIRRLMHKYHLACPIRKVNPYRLLAKELAADTVPENLLQREFRSYGPRMVLLTDITYLPYNGQFAYLSTVLDAYTKQILSYVLSESLGMDFIYTTIQNLIREHGLSLYKETIVHSDQGSHYTSRSFQEILRDKKLRQSMSRRGNCWDNAPQESFFGHMKDDIGKKLAVCKEYDQVAALIDDYMDYYNNMQYQWDLAKLAPNEFYKFCITGEYPLDIPNPPAVPTVAKKPKLLGAYIEEDRK